MQNMLPVSRGVQPILNTQDPRKKNKPWLSLLQQQQVQEQEQEQQQQQRQLDSSSRRGLSATAMERLGVSCLEAFLETIDICTGGAGENHTRPIDRARRSTGLAKTGVVLNHIRGAS